ncbi:hypothetical protein BD410DRAFT_724370, partial [Rickenella mellea]
MLKFNSLNTARSLTARARELDAYKRFLLAVGRGNIPRIHALVATARRQGRGIHAILGRIDLAIKHLYSPKGYSEEEFQRAYLFATLGWRPLLELAHCTLGLPSIDAVKRRVSKNLLSASAQSPTLREMQENLTVCYPTDPAIDIPHALDSVFKGPGFQIMIDEIKIESRLRWDPRSNMILGVCREHSEHSVLEFRSMVQANAIKDDLDAKRLHLGTEATVVAVGSLSGERVSYTARPFVVSATCKAETVMAHKDLLERTIAAAHKHAPHIGGRLYCLGTDGESRRRRSLALLTMVCELAVNSPLRIQLGELEFFDYLCGADEITCDFDFRHVLKRFRNVLLRLAGIKLDGVVITTSILRRHLSASGLKKAQIDSILSPNDKQDVTLMFKLLSAIANLAPADPSDDPPTHITRRLLRLLGRLYTHLLEPYTNVSLTLHEQLSHLSAAAHLVLAIYSSEKGGFIPVQLYYDVMSMIKNAYFCVGKTQLDDPDGAFWIILLGTDGLEKVFGRVRTITGNDTNCDVLQLANRLDGAVNCTNIFALHPDWERGSRRLTLKGVVEQGTDVKQKSDHINPVSWTGDVAVRNVVLKSCWQEGRRVAESELNNA